MDKNKTMSLKTVSGKVIVRIDMQSKNQHTFSNGTTIRLERQFNNLNRRETEPTNGIVVSSEHIPEGSEILVHQNATNEANRIFNYQQSSDIGDIRHYSIPEDHCFIWKDKDGIWQPLPPYETALRVFKPYAGILSGIEPSKIKDTLYVTSGELKGKCVATLKACDFQIVFQGSNGKEDSIIRFRPFGDDKNQREPEAIAILTKETKKIKDGTLYVGLTPSDCKPLKEIINAN